MWSLLLTVVLLWLRVCLEDIPYQFRMLFSDRIILTDRRMSLPRVVHFLSLLPRYLPIKPSSSLGFLPSKMRNTSLRGQMMSGRMILWFRLGCMVTSTLAEKSYTSRITGICNHYFYYYSMRNITTQLLSFPST